MSNIIKITGKQEIQENRLVSNSPKNGLSLIGDLPIDRLEERMTGWFPTVFCYQAGLTFSERENLTKFISHGQFLLSAPPEPEEIAGLFRALIGNLRPPSGMDVKAVSLGYKIALGNVSRAVLKKAANDLISGNAEGFSNVFLPTSAQLAAYCKKIHAATQLTINQACRLLQAKEIERQERISPEKLEALTRKIDKVA